MNGTALDSSEFDFPDLPPYPDDVPTAPLVRLNLQKLLDGEESEVDRLWDSCRNLGFFYLDLRGAKGAAKTDVDAPNGLTNGHTNGVNCHAANGEGSMILDGDEFIGVAEKLFGVAKEVFDLPLEEKIKYDFKERGSYHGYKGYGAGLIDKAGNKDRNEFYNASKDDLMHINPDPLPAPAMLDTYGDLIRSYMRTSHAILVLVLTHLNTKLQLPPGFLPSTHRLHAMSGDQTRFIKSPPQPITDQRAALGAHTDFGSLTVLFNRLSGLQILPPSSDKNIEADKEDPSKWLYVKPLRGHCIVNLGDAMVKFTRGVLRSNVHRVVNPVGKQSDQTRYSLVYFSRPEENIILRPLESPVIDERKVPGEPEGEEVTSKEWVLRRALGRRGAAKDFLGSEGTEGSRGMRQVEVN